MHHDWLTMRAADLGRDIEAGRIDPVDLTDAYLGAIEGHADSARVYACTTPQRARAEAEAARARARAGLRRGPLDGVPISWKDLFDSAGTPTEAGSALLKGRVPEVDAAVLAEATRAGLICLGKTHMSELAFSGLGLNPITATPPNGFDPALAPGGSSSGAAVSVALGLAAGAIGSDTGGSVRIPAAWNGLVGLKTTHGLVPTDGVVPLCEGFDTVGPLGRSVEDCALMLAAMQNMPSLDLAGGSIAGARLMVLTTTAFDDIRDAPARGFEAALARLEAAGAHVERRALPYVAQALALAPILFAPEAYGTWRDAIEAAPEKMFAPICERFRGGRDVTAADYIAGWRSLRDLRRRWVADVAGYDAVVIPTAPNAPPDAARLMADEAFYTSENLLTLRNTRIGNLMGLCGLTLPTSEPGCGISLLGLPMQEARLIRLGHAAEAALA